MPTIVIAAHNEEAVLGACLDALRRQSIAGPLEIIVSANGCTDRTVEVARERGALVIDRPEPGKAAAINAGDAISSHFPRIYLDADIVLPDDGLAGIQACFERSPAPLAVVPRRRLNVSGRTWPVRAYFAINTRLPAFRDGLFGRGMIALSAEGRARFESFPELIADDLFLDSQFSDDEKIEAADVEVVVEAPHTAPDLVRRLIRVRRGNVQMRNAATAGGVDLRVRAPDRWAWLRDVVVHDLTLIPAVIPYVVITVVAGLQARRSGHGDDQWGRDESTRMGSQANDRGNTDDH